MCDVNLPTVVQSNIILSMVTQGMLHYQKKLRRLLCIENYFLFDQEIVLFCQSKKN